MSDNRVEGRLEGGAPSSAHRFRARYGRVPTDHDLARWQHCRSSLLLRLPARARRRTARLLCRL